MKKTEDTFDIEAVKRRIAGLRAFAYMLNEVTANPTHFSNFFSGLVIDKEDIHLIEEVYLSIREYLFELDRRIKELQELVKKYEEVRKNE